MKLPKHLTIFTTLIYGLIVLLPILFMFATAFLKNGLLSIDSIKLVFLNARQWLLIKNSLIVSSGVTLCSLIVGLLLAFLLERTNMWGQAFFRFIYLIPLLIPPYIHAIVWTNLLSADGFIGPLWKIHSLAGVIFILTLSYFPFVTMVVISGLKSVDQHLEEASLLYHGAFKSLKSITLPLITPHVAAGATFVFIFALVNFSVPDILRVNVYPVEIFIQFSAFFNEKAATLLSLPIIFVAATLITIQNMHMKERSYISLMGIQKRKILLTLSPLANSLMLFFCLTLFVCSILVPIIVLFKAAGPFSNYLKGFSTSKEQISYSIFLAFGGALGGIVLSFFISYIIERGSGWRKLFWEFFAMLPFAVPAIVLGIGMIKVWNRPWTNFIYGSSLIIVFGYICRFIPFGIWSMQSNVKQIPVHLEEAGMLHTSSWNKIFRKIVIPLSMPGLITGFFIMFILSLGELSTTLLIIPPGKSTLPIKIYNLMHYGADHMVAALSLMLLGIIMFFFLIFCVLSRLAGFKFIDQAGIH